MNLECPGGGCTTTSEIVQFTPLFGFQPSIFLSSINLSSTLVLVPWTSEFAITLSKLIRCDLTDKLMCIYDSIFSAIAQLSFCCLFEFLLQLLIFCYYHFIFLPAFYFCFFICLCLSYLIFLSTALFHSFHLPSSVSEFLSLSPSLYIYLSFSLLISLVLHH